MYGIPGEQCQGSFGPLRKTNGTTVKAILYARVDGFRFAFQPVQIQVIHLLRPAVFIDNRKRRTAYRRSNAQLITKRVDEGGFTRPHRAVKGKNPGQAKGREKAPGDVANGRLVELNIHGWLYLAAKVHK